jgi:hypothetical protein
MKFVPAILLSFFCLALAACVVAQDATKTAPQPTKFAEFGKMSQAGVKEKMDGFLVELAKDQSAQGYIINSGSPKQISARRMQIMHSITFLKFDSLRITFVDGFPEKTMRTVMWIVPPGAAPPTPK